ncbi:type 1 glutamine amidotransferase [Robbsia sp. Bb-Pol-6]|uniref:Type 1 glutamine amidotransferase n=1 Tax=Robbsia betulipollinis TaxID=2981849 RepID=A0ABT3ZM65_9BURK|nr:type 1 glutamine amidotransferase domain-containing protein [Robbsia betulipollinis]MCY0387638.1 type 1 glutamine amidotransferase [Robbsia betulipollinis]
MTSSNTTPSRSSLDGLKVAILATDGFEQAELLSPREALQLAGARVDVISDKTDTIQGFDHVDKCETVKVDKTFEQALASEYDAVVLPGGVVNGDAIRLLPRAQAFVQAANAERKPLAVICHGGWLLISARIVEGRTFTSWPSLQDDFQNAGAKWVDREVVEDGNLISSRKPDDLPAFNQALIAALGKVAPRSAV